MTGKTCVVAARFIYFAAILVAAIVLTKMLDLLEVPPWVRLFIVFIGTKIVLDMGVALFKSNKRFLYFEDYLRETFVYAVVAAVAVAGVMAVEYYFGGAIWNPLLAAGLVYVWQV